MKTQKERLLKILEKEMMDAYKLSLRHVRGDFCFFQRDAKNYKAFVYDTECELWIELQEMGAKKGEGK